MWWSFNSKEKGKGGRRGGGGGMLLGVQQLETKQRSNAVTVSCSQNAFFVFRESLKTQWRHFQELVGFSVKSL